MHHKQSHGFTLIEILIVIGIMLFLIKIALPRFSGYMNKARQTEVALNLANLYAAEQSYRVEHGAFTNNLVLTGWHPKQHSYTYGFGGTKHVNGTHFFIGSGKTPGSFLKTCPAQADHFIARAALKTKDGVDVWSIDESGQITHDSAKTD